VCFCPPAALLFCHLSNLAHDLLGWAYKDMPLTRVAVQGTGPDGKAPPPFLRMCLILLAAGQLFRRSATLPPGSVYTQARGPRHQVAALRTALQQQLTPSCCAQLLQRLAPGFWVVATTTTLLPDARKVAGHDMDNLCIIATSEGMRAVGGLCCVYDAFHTPAYGIGEYRLLNSDLLLSTVVHDQATQMDNAVLHMEQCFVLIMSTQPVHCHWRRPAWRHALSMHSIPVAQLHQTPTCNVHHSSTLCCTCMLACCRAR
jgi:hypothetical protein